MADINFLVILMIINTIFGQPQHEGLQVRTETFKTSPGPYTNVEPMMISLGVRSKLQCLAQCDRTDDCSAVNYHKEDKTCELIHAHDLREAEHDDIQDGWVKGSKYTNDEDCIIPPPGQGDPPPHDCQGWYTRGCHSNGVYPIAPDDNHTAFDIYCDMDDDGWSVIQTRLNGNESFYDRNWLDYKRGFGNLTDEFWLGNDLIHILTTSSFYELKIELKTYDGQWYDAHFSEFSIGNETELYELFIADYIEGDADYGLDLNDGLQFSTIDSDNDYDMDNCAGDFNMGGWWFDTCAASDYLNGKYSPDGGLNSMQGIKWIQLNGGTGMSLMATIMKVRLQPEYYDDHYDYSSYSPSYSSP
ncbi:unnamed protein product [Owenia fusiformis]|uniref:Fibrinogen C-terminal domain-containing protein n=1 Tax=Owenia fusiformis TaxID=6347 RepID=A0A8S4Q6B7_OWEFU|nr:unnamed protein product [Owenia fusiformis]